MSEWFKDWFNTKYYHILYKNRDHDEAEAFIQQLIAYLEMKPNTKVLDLACGRGRHALYLEQQGFDTTGADLSEQNIKYANKIASDNLHFLQHDMREPIQNANFDVVLNLFTSFGYFDRMEDNEKVLHAIKSYLNNEGDLIIDFMNTVKVRKELASKETKSIEGINFTITKSVNDKRIVKTIEFKDEDQSHFYQEKVQALTLNDFEEMLTQQGYKIINIFGDYQLNPYMADTSERLIIHAKLKN